MPIRRLSLVALVAMAVAIGCHSTTAPAAPDVFRLSSIDGQPLPTTTTTNPAANGAVIQSEELILDDRGVATRITVVQGATPPQVVTNTIPYAYTLVGGVLTLGNILCGPGALCVLHQPEQGPIVGDVLTLTTAPSVVPAGPVLVYRRSTLLN